MSKTTVDVQALSEDIAKVLVKYFGNGAAATEEPATKAKRATKAKAEPEQEPENEADEDDTEDEDPYAERRAELGKKSIDALRKLAIKAGFDPDEVAEADKDEIIESLIEDENSEPEDEDEDAEEEEGEGYSRDDLEAMSLTALKKVARDEYEYTAADLKGLDKDGIIDALLGEGATEDEEEDEEAEDEEDFDGYSEDDLNDMSPAELKEILDEWEVEYRAGAKKATLVRLVLEAQEGDEEDDEDE